MKLLVMLGIARAGRALSLLAAVAAASTACGFWAGSEWAKGRDAIAEVGDLRADAEVLRAAAQALRQRSVDTAQDMRTAARRMDAITLVYAESLHDLDLLYLSYRDALDRQLASAAAADLRACRIGELGMRLWTAAANGHTVDAAGAAAADPGLLEALLPGAPSGAEGRLRAGSDANVVGGGEAVSRLPPGQALTGGGGDGL